MNQELLIHVDEDLDEMGKSKLLETLCEECGGTKPFHHSNCQHQLFVGYDDEKVKPHDIPEIALKHGIHVEVVC